jgi:hypothetical protein
VSSLADRIAGSKRLVLANETRAELIEAHVCRCLRIDPNDPVVGRLALDFATIAGGRRKVEVVTVRKASTDPPFCMYGMKRPHGSEPETAELASQRSVGPFVLDVSDDGIILEEFFPPGANIRERRPTLEELTRYGRELAVLMGRFVIADRQQLLVHRDERADHLFILGSGNDIEVRMIDWGWATLWPITRLTEWASEQFRWLFIQMSFREPEVWRSFVSSLVTYLPPTASREEVAAGYETFALSQSDVPGGRGGGRRWTFPEFLVECGPVRLDVGWLNEFAEKGMDLGPEELAGLWEEMSG